MIKLNPYKKSSFPFYEGIVNSKRDTINKPNLKQELDAISDAQSSCFESYDEAFHHNSLLILEPKSYTAGDIKNLKELYKFRNIKIQHLKNFLTRHPIYTEHILNTCQNCTINEADTMDHILSQSEFPEFSVHPKNLFPCCSVCNRKKSTLYVDGEGSQLFLNLYLDDLPSSQYLHVDFGDNWLPRFRLEQPDDVPDNIFRLIENHYQQLDLLNRFRKSSDEIISTLSCTIKTFKGENIKEKTEEMCQDFAQHFGYNHRQVVIYRALGRSEQFILDCLT